MNELRPRVLVLAGILALAFTGVVGRLGWLQIVRHGDLAAMAERQYSRTVVLQAQRGPILDRTGEPLATSSPAESLFAQPRSVGDPVRVAARLANAHEARLTGIHVGGRSRPHCGFVRGQHAIRTMIRDHLAADGDESFASCTSFARITAQYGLRSDFRIVASVQFVVASQMKERGSSLASPYVSFEAEMRRVLSLDGRTLREDRANGGSYTALALFHFLVRTNLKSPCRELWPDMTKLHHRQCIHDAPWEYCRLRIGKGADETRVLPYESQ